MRSQVIPESIAPSIVELEQKLQGFVDRAALQLGADIVTLYLYDAERDKFFLPVGYGLRDQVTFQHAMPRSDRIAGKIVKGRRPIVADDAKSHPDMGGPFTFRERIESGVGFPILLGNRAVGVFFANFRKPQTFTEEEIRTIERLLQEATEILAASRLAEVRQILTSVVPAMSIADRGLDFIIKSACTFINTPVALWMLESSTNTLSVRAFTGLRREFVESAWVMLDESNIITEVIQSQNCVSISDLENDGRFPFSEELQHEGWKSMLAVPVWTGGRIVGVLSIFTFTKREFAAWEQRLLGEVAEWVSDVLTREQHSQILANLHKIGLALAFKLDLSQVLQLIVDKAAEVFVADIVTLYPYDQDYDEFTGSITHTAANELHSHTRPSKTGIAARIVREGRPIFSDDAEQDAQMSRGFIVRHQVKSSAGFPLKVGDEVVGVLFINYRVPYKFMQSDRDLIALFASQAALAIKNARLFQEQQQRATMAQIASTFSETLDRKKTLQMVVDGARQLTDATDSSLFLFKLETDTFELSARSPGLVHPPKAIPRALETLTHTVLSTGKSILIADAAQDARVRPIVIKEGIRSILGVPVQAKGERIGVLYVSSDQQNRFSQRHTTLLGSLADYGAIAIERTRPLEAITSVNAATANILGLDELIENLLSKIIDELHFEFTALQMINREHNTIETVAGINAPWGAEAKHSLDSNDIQADIVRTCRTEIIAGPDPRFDPSLYERFGHKNLVRIFMPVIVDDIVLGSIEAGYDRRNKVSIGQEEQSSLEALVAQCSRALWEAMLPHALDVIVGNAVSLVRAHSGSIHILYDFEKRRYVYEACAGRIGPEFLEAFPPTAQGIGRQSLRENKPLWIDVPAELERTHPGIYAPEILWLEYPEKYGYGEGVRAIACFPLVTGGKYEGVFYVHFWNEHTFSEDEVEWLNLFADQVSVAIQNAQFYEKLRERSRALTSLSMLGHSLVSELRLSDLLTMIARGARDVLDADIVTIYQYDEYRDFFSWPPTIEGELYKPDFMQTPVEEGDGPWEIVHSLRQSRYAPNVKNDSIMCNRDRKRPASKGKRFVDRERIESSAGILLIVRQEIVGVMFVNYRTRRYFTDSERRVIENFASYAAIAIRTARQAIQQRIDQLETIQTIDREISSTLDLDRVLDLIVHKSMEHLGVTDGCGTLQLFDEKSQELAIHAHKNLSPEQAELRLHIDAGGITPLVARTKEPVLALDTTQEPNYVELMPGVRSEVAVPIVQDDRLIGVLNLESRRPRAFDESDLSFLMLLAGQTVAAIQNARYVQQLEQLRKVLQTITSTTELQTVLAQITESTITVLGADDAVIFPYSSEANEFIIDQVVHRGQAKTQFKPGMPKRGGTAYSVLDQGLVVVDDVASAPPELNLVPGTGLLGEIDARAFIGVVLRVREYERDKVLGVLFIDYRNPHRFTQAELDLIQTLSDQAAIAINNARSYEALRQARDELVTSRKRQVAAETMAALGDIAGNLVHRMNNRLGAIRALSQQISHRFKDDEFIQDKTMKIQDNASDPLQMIRALKKSLEEGRPTRIDLNEVVRAALRKVPVPDQITIQERYSQEPLVVLANRDHLIEVFRDMLENAVEAIENDEGDIEIRTCLSKAGWAEAWITDSGRGIPESAQDTIFEPFFTTKPEGKGLGYGLWWLRTYVQRLGGDVTFTSEIGKGSTFVVELPLHRL